MLKAEACEFLREHNDYLILTHKNPDGDTLGSAAALCSALRRFGKRAWLLKNPEVTRKYLPFVEQYVVEEEPSSATVLAVDVASENMFQKNYAGRVAFCVDHHPSNSGYADHLLLNGSSSSCGEIVLELIKELLGTFTPEEATLLYIAASTDTGCFQYGNTSANTFKAAAELLEFGADSQHINTIFFRKKSSARMKLEGFIYSGMELYHEGRVSVAVVTLEMLKLANATEEDCDDLASLAGKVESSILSVTIREQEDGSSKASLRSGKEINSSDICAVFGGGGHAMAAGCTIKENPETAKRLLLDRIRLEFS